MTNPDTFRLGRVGPATGEIWLAVDDVAFPAPNWDDFVIVILDAWTTALLRLLRGSNQFERVHFMEGPYEVQMRAERVGMVDLRVIDRADGEKAQTTVRIDTLAIAVFDTADRAVNTYRGLGDASVELNRLERTLSDGRAELARMTN
jgi:hypothetical protein